MTIELLMLLPYREEISPAPCVDGTICYFARNPELPGCESHGDTADEARENLREARHLYLQSLLEDGIDPPLPTQGTTVVAGGGALTSVWRIEPEDSSECSHESDLLSVWSAPSAELLGLKAS